MSEGSLIATYGGYVWSSYGLTLLALLWMGISARRSWSRELLQARRRAQAAELEEEKGS